ncbi:signal transduction histidine kinase, with HAMP linker, phosphoacceptor and ATP binding domain [Candidatus Nitrososphaera gargensis Ga9.2]|uniref:histidine kinase n=1 Tax=Nitrososphaera gargensis (strain Ga9.2) TaxID=1237085 RepID=K0IKD3_NITGG|nr:sensor histidine kinase [Candidatus Nitrososphaera gargensis]AFU59688.1 signal transduction histidine kinase, with HAMP linker, phosphoacceptor and ATP binding domain [Candidatus Nitrososphaera gargensis Ga9.2]
MKIRAKLTIVTISLIIASIVIPSIIALESFSQELESQITHNLEQESIRSIDKISRFLFERQGDIKLLTDPSNSIMRGPSISQKLEYLQSVEKTYQVYSAFSIYDKNGIKIADTHDFSIGADSSNEPFFVNAMKGNIHYDSVPTFSNDVGQYVMHFSGPLLNEDGNIDGVLAGIIPISRIYDIVEQASQSRENLQADLVSSGGLVIYSNYDKEAIMQKNLSYLPIFGKIAVSGNPSESYIGSVNDVDEAEFFSNDETIYVAASEQGFLDYKGNQWILIIAVPTEVAFKEVTQLQNNFIIVAIAILSAAIIPVIIFSKAYTQSLIKLKNAAAEIAKGNFDIAVEINSNDEIGELSQQFDKMKNDLKDRERLKDEFINIAAHELRSPLQPIISYNELALKGLMDKDEALRIIDSESQRFIKLANDILDVTRIEGGALSYNMQRIKIIDIISRIVSSTKISDKLGSDVSIDLVKDKISDAVEVYGDENRLSQVFMNIIDNAVKFTRKGRIRIETRVQENKLGIKISDTGGGIPAEIMPKLFGKFVTKSVQGGTEHGTGLGLFISKAIVTAHGGEIYAQNNSEGGATFTILLPIADGGVFN